MRRLTEQEKQAIMKYHEEGLGDRKISEIMGINESTVHYWSGGYYKISEVRERIKRYYLRPDVKLKTKERARIYRRTPEGIAKIREYTRRIKERKREYDKEQKRKRKLIKEVRKRCEQSPSPDYHELQYLIQLLDEGRSLMGIGPWLSLKNPYIKILWAFCSSNKSAYGLNGGLRCGSIEMKSRMEHLKGKLAYLSRLNVLDHGHGKSYHLTETGKGLCIELFNT